MINRDFLVRRGRNARILFKLIEKNIFEDESTFDLEDGKPLAGRKRRKVYYQTTYDYINRELPEMQEQYFSILRDRKFLSKKFKHSQTLYVKDAASRIIKKQL